MHDYRGLSHVGPATATDPQVVDVDPAGAPEWHSERFLPLRVKGVIRETRYAISIVLDVPESIAQQFRYEAGQFLTLLVSIDGKQLQRCYSMSSSPAEGEDLRITVKRDRDGVVSNWLNDTAAPGSSCTRHRPGDGSSSTPPSAP